MVMMALEGLERILQVKRRRRSEPALVWVVKVVPSERVTGWMVLM